MIEAEINISGKKITLTAKGHADYAPYGADIVCAGVSGVIVGLSSALSDKHTEGRILPGDAYICARNTKLNRAAFGVCKKTLEAIAAEYPANLHFTYLSR